MSKDESKDGKNKPAVYSPKARSKKGNDHGVKFPTPEDRQRCCEAYIEHIKQGYSQLSFSLCSPSTMKKYIKEFPEDFDVDMIEAAFREGRRVWEEIGMEQAKGINGGNASTWFRVMQNQYDYRDRLDVTSKDEAIAPPIDMSKLGDKELDQLATIMAAAISDEGEDE